MSFTTQVKQELKKQKNKFVVKFVQKKDNIKVEITLDVEVIWGRD